jgi:tetratricopeptide (TPR) repeat protein/predicted aspartyl protease
MFGGIGVRKELVGVAIAVLVAIGAQARAEAACSVSRIAELPVTMDDMGPMVDSKINGTPVRFIADSGAFFSAISPGSAQSLHLALAPAPFGMYVRGINGTAEVSVATVRTFTLAGVDIPHAQFIVAGSEMGGVGVIGQNVFGLGDVEYDLPHGAIRLMKSAGCEKANLAYWAGGRSYSLVTIDPRSPQQPHTIGTVYINGKPIRATFDTGSGKSMLSLAAAARVGIRPDSPGVVEGGYAYGFGRKLVRTWIAPLQSFAIGDGEQIQHARIRIGAMDGIADMLIGADFFIAHRVYVDNRTHRLFLTYEGGPVFNLKAHYDGPDGKSGAAADATTAAAAAAAPPADAESHSRDGAVATARRDFDTAIVDYSQAIALAPREPRYLDQRAEAYFRQGKTALGRADLDRAIALAPSDLDALLARAALEVHTQDRTGALADLDAVDHAADAAAMERLELGGLLTDASQPQRAIGQYDQWIKTHPDDVRRPVALNDRCWARALAGQDLDAALRDCDAALRARPGASAFLDSRGLVELRRGDWAKAIADYSAALAGAPKMAWSLYGRGIAELHTGDAAGAKADIAAAAAIRPAIAEDAKGYGITP